MQLGQQLGGLLQLEQWRRLLQLRRRGCLLLQLQLQLRRRGCLLLQLQLRRRGCLLRRLQLLYSRASSWQSCGE